MSDGWKQRPEAGTRFVIRLMRDIGRHGGRGVARLLLWPVTLYYLLARAPERQASRAFLSRVAGRRVGIGAVARHLHSFASTILDRVFLLAGRLDEFDARVDGLEALRVDMQQGRGVLLFGSHLGSFEVLRVLARRRPEYSIRVVLDKSHAPALTALLDELNPQLAANVIDASQDGTSIVMAIKQACDEGALVALLVDRARPGEATVAAPFLGGTAHFPTSPWLIASLLGVPVQLGFGLYRGGRRYDLRFEPFADCIDLPRAQRQAGLQALIHRYAARLETVARDAPDNWFNFYDFWQPPAAGGQVVRLHDARRGTGVAHGGDGPAAGHPGQPVDPAAARAADADQHGLRRGS